MAEIPSRDTSWASPSTADYLAFHAAHRPDAIAVIGNGVEYSYARFHRDLQKMTHALAAFGLERGSLVAVACGGVYIHWLLLLGWENLGIATASFIRGEASATLLALLARADLVMSEVDLPPGSKARHHTLTPPWVAAVLGSALPPTGDQSIGPGVGLAEVLRIRRSSGTTGGQKMMAVTRQMEEFFISGYLLRYGFTPSSRSLIVLGFGVAAAYANATACLRLGATVVFDTRLDAARCIVEYQPSHVRLYPYQLPALLAMFATDLPKPKALTVSLGAAPLSKELRSKVLKLLATRLIYSYNCNEAGTIAEIDADGNASLLPGIQAEVVEKDDAPAQPDQIGRVRVRSPAMVEGYLDNPEATAQMFRDGWFYTGDAGIMVGPRRLKIVGRVDELLNVGGLKVSPEDIRNSVAQVPGVVDVGVTSVANADGVEEIGIAVVLGEGADMGNIHARIARRMKVYGNAQLIAVARIPRTAETGKIQRAELKKLFVRA